MMSTKHCLEPSIQSVRMVNLDEFGNSVDFPSQIALIVSSSSCQQMDRLVASTCSDSNQYKMLVDGALSGRINHRQTRISNFEIKWRSLKKLN